MSAEKAKGKKSGQNVAVWMDDETVKHIDRLAEKIGITRSKMAGNLVGVGLSDALLLEKSGILPVALVLRKLHEAWNSRCGFDPEMLKTDSE